MTPLQIQQVVEQVQKALQDPSNYPWLVAIAAFVVIGLMSFLGAYLAEKAKGVATKEDVQKLTALVKEVEQKYVHETEILKAGLQREVELYKAGIQFRNAALDNRLETHQRAYSIMRKLWRVVAYKRYDDAEALLNEATSLWIESSLYLSPVARDAYTKALDAASFVVNYSSRSNNTPKTVELDEIDFALLQLVKAVDLPELDESNSLRRAAELAKGLPETKPLQIP